MNRILMLAAAGVVVVGLGVFAARHMGSTPMAVDNSSEVGRVIDTLGGVNRFDNARRIALLRTLRQALENERSVPLTPEREQLLERGIRCLDELRAGAVDDSKLGAELAAAYQQFATLFEAVKPPRALSLYQTALLIVIQCSGGDPRSVGLQSQYDLLATRIRGLGGTVLPIDAPVTERRRPQQRSAVSPSSTAVQEAALPPPQPSPESQIKMKDRYITVAAKCQSAEDAYAHIRQESSGLGEAPHPDISTAYSRMRMALDMARREMDDGRFDEARESLNTAEASAMKVLRAAGGN